MEKETIMPESEVLLRYNLERTDETPDPLMQDRRIRGL
jgi:hypothetical protein